MPLLDIATAQPSLQNRLGSIGIHHRALSTPFKFGDENRLLSVGKIFQFPKKLNFQHKKSTLKIKAVAALEPKCSERKEDGQKRDGNAKLGGADLDPSAGQAESPREKWMALDERERLRRTRISKANKGNAPWNKGRKHSPETIQRIRERTKIAMQNPKVKMKLANLGHAQSDETKKKIGLGVRVGWQKRREKLMLQETCYFEWQNLLAEASRRGYAGEEELQWDSYSIISETLKLEWVESIEERKIRPRGSRRAPKPPEQRRKIAAAIAAKWADPEYRQRVCSALSRYHGVPVGVGKKQRQKPSSGAQSIKRAPVKKKLVGNSSSSASSTPMLRKNKAPSYRDPLARSKLQMIKNIRAQRAATEAKRTEAVEKARLLIAEAEKAAKALEVAATKSPVARASLVETRKLIADAIRSIKSIDTGFDMPKETEARSALTPAEPIGQDDKVIDIGNGGLNHAELRGSNGTSVLASGNDQDLNFSNLTLHEIINGGQQELLPSSSGRYGFYPFSLESFAEHSSSSNQLDQWEVNGKVKHDNHSLPNGSKAQLTEDKTPSKSVATTKKWVRGRLVEVTEEV